MTSQQKLPSNLCDSKALLEQFKDYMYRSGKISVSSSISSEYKKIYSDLCLSNKRKRFLLIKKSRTSLLTPQFQQTRCGSIISNLQTAKIQKVVTKFSLIKTNFLEEDSQENIKKRQIKTGLTKSKIPRSKTGSINKSQFQPTQIDKDYKNKGELQERILMENMFNQRLKEEISNLKMSYQQLKKDVEEARMEFQVQQLKYQKFKEVSYLSSSVKQQTDHIRINNFKDFQKMVRKHEQTLNCLKKYKSTIRRQNQDLQAQYLSHPSSKKQRSLKRPITTNNFTNSFSNTHTISHLKNTEVNLDTKMVDTNQIITKAHLKMMQYLEKVIELLIEKEEDFQNIKASQCTKIKQQGIAYEVLDEDRGKKMLQVLKFEQKFDLRIESVAHILIKIYQNLNTKILEKQKIIMELNGLKENYNEEELFLSKKIGENICQQSQKTLKRNEKQQKNVCNSVKHITTLFIKVIGTFYLILSKFKHIFKISLTLNIEKKNFNQYLIQIDKAFFEGLYFHSQFAKSFQGSSHDQTNMDQLSSTLMKSFPNIKKYHIKELCRILFNDIRLSLILRRSWVLQDLKNVKIFDEENLCILIQGMALECEEVYEQKLKVLSNLFMNCLKSITLNKYQRKIVSQKISDADFYFFPKHSTKIGQPVSDDQQFQKMNLVHPDNKELETVNQETDIQIQTDPRSILLKLKKAKKDEGNKFKILNFNVDKNAYVQKFNLRIMKKMAPLKDYITSHFID